MLKVTSSLFYFHDDSALHVSCCRFAVELVILLTKYVIALNYEALYSIRRLGGYVSLLQPFF